MPLTRKVFLMLAAITALGLAAPAVYADTVIIGGTFGQNRFPFGTDPIIGPNYTAGATYQQIHSGAAFGAGPITITQIAFASVPFAGGGPGTANFNFNLRLGTAATTVTTVSSTFSANRGVDFTTVFSGGITAMMTRTSMFDFVIDLTTPFTYNPSSGDLLLDVVINSPTMFSNGSLYFLTGASADARRVFNVNPSLTGTVDTVSLRTRIEFTPAGGAIPEPTTLLLLGTGLAGVATKVRKRRKADNSEGV